MLHRTENLNFILYPAITVLLIVLSIIEVLLLRSHLDFEQSAVALKFTAENKLNTFEEQLPDGQSTTTFLAQLSSNFFTKPETNINRALIHRRLALNSANMTTRLENLCLATSAAGEGVNSNPVNGQYLALWSELRQLLGQVSCHLQFTVGGYKENMLSARHLEPNNSTIEFTQIRTLLRDGSRKVAYNMLKSSLLHRAWLSKEDINLVLNEIKFHKLPEEIVPERLDQVIMWLDFLKKREPTYFSKNIDKFEKLQARMLDREFEMLTNLETEQINSKIDQYWKLYKFMSSDFIRIKIDSALAKLYANSGAKNLSQYFDEKSRLHRININRGLIKLDYKPLNSNLSYWNLSSNLNLDKNHQSIGIYHPLTDEHIKTIEFFTPNNIHVNYKKSLRVYSSHDNLKWKDVTSLVRIMQLDTKHGTIISIATPSLIASYWKILFESSLRTRDFEHSLESLINAYN